MSQQKANPAPETPEGEIRLPGCNCWNPCQFSDAWKCARDKKLWGRIACDCESHMYIHQQIARATLGESK